MRIKRILNNNAVVSLDENENEVILLGSGIAFKRKIDDEIPLCSVDKIFSLKNLKTSRNSMNLSRISLWNISS